MSVNNSIDQKTTTLFIIVYLANAFDLVDQATILHYLETIGIRGMQLNNVYESESR